MASLKIQFNTPVEVTRDLKLTFIHEATGRETTAAPFLDGSLSLRNLDPGAYRLKAVHPNITLPVFDKRIRVWRDRPTFVPIKIPSDIFSNNPIRDTPLADLNPARAKLQTSLDTAEAQTRKKGGQPIYADDWNELSGAVADVAQSTLDLSRLVSPVGHDHPEIEEKLAEIHTNLQRFLDVFGKSLVQLQRQIQILALQRRVDEALDQVPGVTDETRKQFQQEVSKLEEAGQDNPYVFTTRMRRVGEILVRKVEDILPADDPEVGNRKELRVLSSTAAAMGSSLPVNSYDDELLHHSKTDRKAGVSGFSSAMSKRI